MFANKIHFIALAVIICLGLTPKGGVAIPLTDTDNKHNLSSSATHAGPKAQIPSTGGTDQICIFCHTPHSATPDSPLWSRPDPSKLNFKVYNQSLAIKGDFGLGAAAVTRSQYNVGTYPNGASRLCLSCHDGVTSMGILNDGTSIAMAGGVDTLLGTVYEIDLSTSHPISFIYNTGVLADVNTAHGAGAYQLPPSADGIDTPLDGNEKMQCTTCHDPHEDTRATLSLPFWRHDTGMVSGWYIDVCNQCHLAGSGYTGPSGDHSSGPGITP